MQDIGSIMSNVRNIQEDMAKETMLQTERLHKTEDNTVEAYDNSKNANESLAAQIESGGCCKKCLIWAIVLVCIGLTLIIIFRLL